MRTVIVEDDLKARDSFVEHLKNGFPELEIVGLAEDIEEAEKVILATCPDLLFLDVELKNSTSSVLLKKISDRISCEVIFTTSYDNYAIEAFKVSAIDYLLKPIDEKELSNAIEKAKKQIFKKNKLDRLQIFLDNIEMQTNQNQKIILPGIEGNLVIKISEIKWCESNVNYTKFHFIDNKEYLVSRTLKEYDNVLCNRGFFRIHKSYLVNMEFIRKIVRQDGNYVLLKDSKVKLPLAKSKKDDLMKQLNNIA